MKKIALFLILLCFLSDCIFSISFFSKIDKSKKPLINISREDKKRIGEIECYEHNQLLKLTDENQIIKIHSKPFSFKVDNVFYTAKKGDEIKINSVLFSQKFGTSCLLVSLESGLTGFIPISRNPYRKDQFTFKEKINLNGKLITILNLRRIYTFESFTDNPASIFSQPDFDSELLVSMKVNDVVKLEAKAITSDYKWLYVNYDNQDGWISTKYLCVDIGGSVLNTPEEMICEELLWKNFR